MNQHSLAYQQAVAQAEWKADHADKAALDFMVEHITNAGTGTDDMELDKAVKESMVDQTTAKWMQLVAAARQAFIDYWAEQNEYRYRTNTDYLGKMFPDPRTDTDEGY